MERRGSLIGTPPLPYARPTPISLWSYRVKQLLASSNHPRLWPPPRPVQCPCSSPRVRSARGNGPHLEHPLAHRPSRVPPCLGSSSPHATMSGHSSSASSRRGSLLKVGGGGGGGGGGGLYYIRHHQWHATKLPHKYKALALMALYRFHLVQFLYRVQFTMLRSRSRTLSR